MTVACLSQHGQKRAMHLLMLPCSRTVLNIASFAAILYSISPAACYGVLVYSIVGTIVATKGFGPWLGFYQLQRVKQEAGLRGGLRLSLGVF